MNIIKPSYLILSDRHDGSSLKLIEEVGRTCYKSEDKITDHSSEKFVSGIIRRGHEAVVEHGYFIFELCSKSYLDLTHTIRHLSDYGFKSFIRITNDERPIASANVRAWRDFFKECRKHDMDIPEYMKEFVIVNPLLFPEFQDVVFDLSIDKPPLFKPLTVEDLRHIEKLFHINVSVKLTNDRGVSHEEVRHRVASFAQESTRYCNYTYEKFGNEITYIDLWGGMEYDSKVRTLPSDVQQQIYDEWLAACMDAERHYDKMIELGATPQIARSVLNNSTKTEICITMNLNDWRHFFKLRTSTAAHPQIREIAIMLLGWFKENYPTLFDDIRIED